MKLNILRTPKALWSPFLSLESSSNRKAHHCPHTEHAQLACLGNRLFCVVSNFPHSTWSVPGSAMLYVLTVGHCFVPSYPFLKMYHILFSILLLMVSILQKFTRTVLMNILHVFCLPFGMLSLRCFRLVSNSASSCLCILSTEINGMHHHTQPSCVYIFKTYVCALSVGCGSESGIAFPGTGM